MNKEKPYIEQLADGSWMCRDPRLGSEASIIYSKKEHAKIHNAAWLKWFPLGAEAAEPLGNKKGKEMFDLWRMYYNILKERGE